MPNEPPPPVSLEVSSEFKRNLRVLAKRYRSIRSDLEPVLAQLQAGECPGDQIAGIDAHPSYDCSDASIWCCGQFPRSQ